MNTSEHRKLVDICTVSVDMDLPDTERIMDYLRQVKNPYHFICDGITITARFPKDGPTIVERLQPLIAY